MGHEYDVMMYEYYVVEYGIHINRAYYLYGPMPYAQAEQIVKSKKHTYKDEYEYRIAYINKTVTMLTKEDGE